MITQLKNTNLMPKKSIQDKWWQNVSEKNDITSFTNLHKYFYPTLVEFSCAFLGQQEPCEEVVDDVFVNLWEKRNSLTNVKNIKSYLFTSTRNKALDYLRKANTEPSFDKDLFKLEIIKYDRNVDADVENQEFLELLNEAVDQLPPKCKIIFKMHLNDNLKNGEIAEIMEVAKKTVEAQIYIAYQKLTAILKKSYFYKAV